jgi:hypothetical protein
MVLDLVIYAFVHFYLSDEALEIAVKSGKFRVN